jgi:metal-responsive CopG/Arc/MetJ family transcriptional regulator
MDELDALARQENTTLADVLRELVDRALHGQRAQAAPAPQQGSAGTAQPAEGQAAHRNNLRFYFSVDLTPSLYQILTEAAESLGVSRSVLVKRAVAAGLEYVKSAGRLPPCPYEFRGEHKVQYTANLTASLLREVDDTLSRLGKINRSYFIRRSVCYYITSVMKQGGEVRA